VLPEIETLGSFDPSPAGGHPQPTASPPSVQAFDELPSTRTTTSYIPVPSNATIPATAPNITYSGNWTNAPPVCEENVNTTAAARRSIGAGNLFSYSFKGEAVYPSIVRWFDSRRTTGKAVYLKLGTGPDSGVFRVELDGEVEEVDSFEAVDNTCKVGYQKENLEDKQHNMIITTLGPSPQAPQADGTLDIENIMYAFCLLCATGSF
jgi:hypothetical protein